MECQFKYNARYKFDGGWINTHDEESSDQPSVVPDGLKQGFKQTFKKRSSFQHSINLLYSFLLNFMNQQSSNELWFASDRYRRVNDAEEVGGLFAQIKLFFTFQNTRKLVKFSVCL